MINIESLQNNFNRRLKNWYENAKRDYNVTGAGECKILPDEKFPCGTQSYKIIVVYTENNTQTKCYHVFCEEWRGDKNLLSYLFDIWTAEGFTKIN